jgi:hypothetical protein
MLALPGRSRSEIKMIQRRFQAASARGRSLRSSAAARGLGCMLSVMAGLAVADPLPPLDRASLSFGPYDSHNRISGRWDAADGAIGSEFDVARDFGTAPRTQAWMREGTLRIGDALELRGFGYGYRGSGSGRLASSFDFGGVRYAADAEYAGGFGVDIRGLAATWYFHQDDDSAFGAGLGLVRYAIDGSVSARARIDDREGRVANGFDEAATLPLLRIAGSIVLAPQLRAGAELAYVRKPSGTLTGHAADAALKLDWFPWTHAGVGLRWNFNRVDLGLAGRRYAGRLRVENRGPQVLLTLRW